jgi:elongator complex protein 3
VATDSEKREREWWKSHGPIDVKLYGETLRSIILEVQASAAINPRKLRRILARHPRRPALDGRTLFSKHELVGGYRLLCDQGLLEFQLDTLRRLQMKPMRTLSGVAPVTVLTKPYPCPGECIFCPSDATMPKSYLADEPGAMRAAYHDFDPYEQTAARIRALENIGHPTDKIELLILGGTWDAYPAVYQEWFVRRCLDAMNGTPSQTLFQAQARNEQASHRNTGIVTETRPDTISAEKIWHLRRLGVTKVQLGVQSLDDNILGINKRGHTAEDTRNAFRLLRLAGFKIAAHWMPNLLGASPSSDLSDFDMLWSDPALRPDELKIYPCALLADTALHEEWRSGRYQPYDEETLIQLVADCKARIPAYCRVNRIARDIPATNIVAGSKRANLRQLARERLVIRNQRCRCIRCREVRFSPVDLDCVNWSTLVYPTDVTFEFFVGATTQSDELAGFLRLSLPKRSSRTKLACKNSGKSVFDEIENYAMIRQIHVYGPALEVGSNSNGEAQHSGIGQSLMERAKAIARSEGFQKISVIAAVGTREYYRQNGFELGELYMSANL